MSGSILSVQCPECQRIYTIYPGPDEYMRCLITRKYEMECDYCEKELVFKVTGGAKAPFTTGGT